MPAVINIIAVGFRAGIAANTPVKAGVRRKV